VAELGPAEPLNANARSAAVSIQNRIMDSVIPSCCLEQEGGTNGTSDVLATRSEEISIP